MTTALCLGTAQFGMEYGLRPVGRPPKKPSRDEVFRMLDLAREGGIEWLDTSAAYGDAEILLGDYPQGSAFHIATKQMPNRFEQSGGTGLELLSTMRIEYQCSVARLNQAPRVYLFHSSRYIFRPELTDAFLKFQTSTLRVGVSCYEPEEAHVAIRLGMRAIQIPSNVLDQRFAKAGILETAQARDVQVFARQPFLQGLLLLHPNELPDRVQQAHDVVRAFQIICAEQGLTSVHGALGFALTQPGVDYVVFGVENGEQLQEDLAAASHVREGFDRIPFQTLADNISESIVNPSRWK